MSQIGDDDDNKKVTAEPYKRLKVKLSTVFDKNAKKDEIQKIKTKVYVDGIEGEITINSLKDLEDQFAWGCKAEFALEINKFWAMKTAKNGGEKECGYGVKCIAIHVLEKAKPKGNSQALINFGLFGSSSNAKSDEKSDDKSDNESEKYDEHEENTKSKGGKATKKKMNQMTNQKKNQIMNQKKILIKIQIKNLRNQKKILKMNHQLQKKVNQVINQKL